VELSLGRRMNGVVEDLFKCLNGFRNLQTLHMVDIFKDIYQLSKRPTCVPKLEVDFPKEVQQEGDLVILQQMHLE
jgi:hypothetical protein